MIPLLRSFILLSISWVTLIAIDCLWLTQVMKDFYRIHLHAINKFTDNQALVFNVPAAIATWALITVGLMLFVLPRVITTPYTTAFLWGACFGFIVYGVYDLTNLATIKDWTPQLAVYDLLWGTLLNGIMACIMKWINTKL